jgi:hypothetical protein
MPSNCKEDSVSVPTYEKPETVGRALRIVTDLATSSPSDEPVAIYIPLSCVQEKYDDYVVIDQWIAEKKGLI